MSNVEQVIDSNPGDTAAYLLLTTMDHVDLRAVIITNADTIAEYAMQVQWKTMRYIQDKNVPIGLSSAIGWNAFPWFYRQDVILQSSAEVFSEYEDNLNWPPFPSGDVLLHDLLVEALEKDTP